MKLAVVIFKNTIEVLKLRDFGGKLDDDVSHLLLSRGCILK